MTQSSMFGRYSSSISDRAGKMFYDDMAKAISETYNQLVLNHYYLIDYIPEKEKQNLNEIKTKFEEKADELLHLTAEYCNAISSMEKGIFSIEKIES